MTDWYDDPRYTEHERELEWLMWTDRYAPSRPRRDMTTVELPRFPDDDALGFCWRTNGGAWPCAYCYSPAGCSDPGCYE